MIRYWKKILLFSGLAVVALCTMLVVHIIIVTKPGDGFHAQLQLGRIDFSDTLTSDQGREAVRAVRSIDGISIAKLNVTNTSLIYSFPTGKLKCADVFSQFDAQVDFSASPYLAPSTDQATGCPIMDKSSLAYRFTTFIKNTFH